MVQKLNLSSRHAAFAAPVLAALALAAIPGTSSGALMVTLNGGATVFTDNGAGDNDAAVGRITSTALVAGFGIAITVASSNSPGTAAAGLLQVSSVDIQNLGSGVAALTVQVSDTNYTLPGGAGSGMKLESSAGGTFTQGVLGNSVLFRSFADPSNAQPAAATSTPLQTFLRATPDVTESFNNTNSTNWTRGAGPYSLSNTIVITLSAGGQINFSGSTAAIVPEPATAALLAASAAPLLGRRRTDRAR